MKIAWKDLGELKQPIHQLDPCFRLSLCIHVKSRLEYFENLIQEKRDFHVSLTKLAPNYPTNKLFYMKSSNGRQIMQLYNICNIYENWLNDNRMCVGKSTWWKTSVKWLRSFLGVKSHKRYPCEDDSSPQGLREAFSTYSLYGSTVPLIKNS